MPRLNPLDTLTAGLCVAALAAAPHTLANTVPFTETFTGGFDGDAWVDDTTDPSYDFAPNAATDTYDVTLTNGSRSYSTVGTTGIPTTVGTVITTSTEFTLTDADTATTRIGFVLLADTAAIEGTGSDPNSIIAYISEPGGFVAPVFVVRDLDTFNDDISDPFTTLDRALTDATYRLDAITTIVTDGIETSLTLTNLSTLESETADLAIDTAIPTGGFVGLHTDRNGGGPASTIAFDNYSVSVSVIPEPASAVLFAAGLGLLVRRRANRRA
ncbi:MAG: PEP-CTERM sorting domain-containing protein [Planctomycetota bacterium]